ncbi:MAG: 7,8-didemethyl-8-hydroxy-5-deazariboflavin synthase CofG [candidate division NC10 bacterium]|nr:7,8-didemethyl-8-hydroxy-5-deazariboflavin synthase CofG [candidate division NC10 bacterium]MDE2320882.1 7,8-didemethyl-8-hydroxy-5-deazariboflavin synthase CofG [candidate division NC10 bacterium]
MTSPEDVQTLMQGLPTAGPTTLPNTDPSLLERLDRQPSPEETSAAIQTGLDQVYGGRPLTRQQAALLLHAEGRHLRRLLELASAIRDRGKGRTVTFSKKVFIPLTRLCRDRCGYCAFRRDPGDPGDGFMTPDEVLAIAAAGAALGCKEALFSLGERPETAFPEARRALADRGHRSSIEYLARMCERIVAETGLLPHVNPGTMNIDEMTMLRDTTVSMGLMLESVSTRLLQPGGPHHSSPDKHPLRRLRTIESAGRLQIAFTTGILIGIGESLEDRIDALLAIKALHRRFGHIQEVIVQNFRAKPFTPMQDYPQPTLVDLLRTVAVARLILGPDMNLQAPPNLNQDAYPLLLLSGINDWGGISPLTQDHINPEAPWPEIEALRDATSTLGFRLQERLPIYPEYIVRKDGFIPAPLVSRIMALVDEAGYPIEQG